MTEPASVHVAAGAMVRDDGRVLIMQRLPGTPYAGCWEFPGGKLEAGESVAAALARELDEELGITPLDARPLIRIRHRYPHRTVLLDCWRVTRWRGDAAAREGHELAWPAPGEFDRHEMLAADRPVVTALRLPPRLAITADVAPAALLAGVDRLLAAGHMLIQLRAPVLAGAALAALAADAVRRCHAHGARLLVNGDPAVADAAGADGVHLSAARLRALDVRPLAAPRLVGASCHDRAELEHARRIGCDFALLGPLRATASHPHASPLGWDRFAALADCAGLPVYALGGLGDADLDDAWHHHGQGVAGISAWW